MATSLISMAQQLKFMIDQAKVQSEALKDTAVTQAKIHAEADKREVTFLSSYRLTENLRLEILLSISFD